MSDCIIVVDHAEKRFGEQVALRDVFLLKPVKYMALLAEMALEKRCFSNVLLD